MSKKYKSLFFDLDNTLWDFEKNSLEALRQTFLKYNLHARVSNFEGFHQLYSRINENYWKDYRNKLISKQQLTSRRFQDTFDSFTLNGIDAAQFNEDYLRIMPGYNILIDGAVDLLNYLQGKGYKMYIITNGFHEVQHNKLEVSGLIKYFDRVFISEDIKAPKPNREIFEYALKSSNSSKKFSLMIGDSWESDIMGAINFGMDQVYYSPNDKVKLSLGEKTGTSISKPRTIKINKLIQLQGIL